MTGGWTEHICICTESVLVVVRNQPLPLSLRENRTVFDVTATHSCRQGYRKIVAQNLRTGDIGREPHSLNADLVSDWRIEKIKFDVTQVGLNWNQLV